MIGRGAKNLLEELPHSTDSQEKANQSEEKLEIAWQYQNQKRPEQITSGRFGHYWDVSTVRKVEEIKSKLYHIDTNEFKSGDEFMKAINERVTKIIDTEKSENRILRICLLDVGGPLWPSVREISLFMLRLRAKCNIPHSILVTCPPSTMFLMAQFSDVQLTLANFLVAESEYRIGFGLPEIKEYLKSIMYPKISLHPPHHRKICLMFTKNQN